nr:PorP/SprF family type IX secretion system membrane protein [Pedobacter sp. ASV2]
MKKILLSLILLFSMSAYSQINPLETMYYVNEYLGNPAMAGVQKGWEINAAYKRQWSAIEGAPSMQAVTTTHGSSDNKVGIGVLFYNERAGVIQRTSFKGSFAYHLPLTISGTFMDFGLSIGGMHEWIDFQRVNGDQSDINLIDFNQRKLYFDADFGIAFRNRHLNIQASIPNMKSLLKRDLKRSFVGRYSYFGSFSYKFFNVSELFNVVEPKLISRWIYGYRTIVDLGLNFELLDNKLLLNTIYHSTSSFTMGVGTMYQNRFSILALYTTNTGDLRRYANGEFEIGLKFNFK